MRKDYERHHEARAKAYEGFEAWLHAAKMNFKMLIEILMVAAVVFWVLYFLYWLATQDRVFLYNLKAWFTALVFHFFLPGKLIPYVGVDGAIHLAPAGEMYAVWKGPFLRVFYGVFREGFRWFIWAEVVALFGGVLYFRWKAREVRRVDVVRGPRLVEVRELDARLRKKYGKGRLRLTEGVVLPRAIENRHGFVIGTSGSGKSTLLKGLVTQIRKRREKAVVFDVKGEYVSLFYDPDEGDVIFNPMDRRMVSWSLVSDLETRTEAFDFAASFIPKPPEVNANEEFFRDAAREVFAAILAIARKENLSNEEIARLVFSPLEVILETFRRYPEATKGLVYIQKVDSNQAPGVQSTMAQFLRSIEWLQGVDGPFSLKNWIREDGSGILFLPVPPAHQELLTPLITAVVNVLIREGLSLPDDLGRRRWFIIDELGALNRLDLLVKALTEGRSKGMSVWLGIQDYGRVDILYGRSIRETLWNNALTKVVLRVEAPDTARYLSSSLGEAEVEVAGGENLSMGPEEHRDGFSIHRTEHIKPLVLPSEIQTLEDLTCFVRVGPFGPALDHVIFRDFSPVTEGVILRDEPPPVRPLVLEAGRTPEKAEKAEKKEGDGGFSPGY